jgi:heat shock protein HslJ
MLEPYAAPMRPTAVRTTVLLPLFLLALAACGNDTSGPTGEPAATLDGRSFVGDQVTGHDLVAGTTVRLSFEDGRVRAQAGCNHLAGKARLDKGVLVVGDLSTTEMGCSRQLMDQDAWVAAFLTSRPEASVDAARLVLATDEVTMELADQAALRSADPIPLEGTTWLLESILAGSGDDGVASSVPGERPPSVRIDGGRITVFTGCNHGSGMVDVGATTLTVSKLGLTRMACPDSPERTVLAMLDGEVGYVQDYDTLTLTASDGESGLQFRAAP